MVRGMIDGEVSTAFENARLLVDAERAMGLFFEPALQAWALTVPGLIEVASALYVNTHFLVTTSFIVWLYLRRNDDFYVIRDMFMVVDGRCPGLLPAVPHRAAKDAAGVGLQRLGGGARRPRDLAGRGGALQPLRRGAEHARGLRADGRAPGGAPRALPRPQDRLATPTRAS
ncbi:MAG: phosphatase PAP2 family protein [Thermoleophilaceae bacterium]